MSEEICCITKKGRVAKKDGKLMSLTFFELYSVYKKLGQLFLHTCLLTILKKDMSVLLTVIDI